MSKRIREVTLARKAQKAERHEDVIRSIKVIASSGVELTETERRLMHSAYKALMLVRRSALQIIDDLQMLEDRHSTTSDRLPLIEVHRNAVKKELREICEGVNGLIDKQLLPYDRKTQNQVYYFKTKGDFYRYWAENASSEERTEAVESALFAYQMGTDIANENLRPTDPIRLGLALNFAVFFCSTLGSTERAVRYIRGALDDAISDLAEMTRENYEEAAHILQLMRDNHTLWTIKLRTANEKRNRGGQRAPKK